MTWDWEFTIDILPSLMEALVVTVQATLMGSVLAFLLGLVLAIIRRSPFRPARWAVVGFVEFVRSTPLLVQLFFLFFVLPRAGIRLPALVAGVLGLGLHYSTYVSEVYRAGIESIPKEQWEAARALSFSKSRLWFAVILPQAVPRVIPPLGNYVIGMFKDTPLLSAITVLELLARADVIGSQTYRYLEPMTLVGVLFFIVGFPAAVLLRRLEARLVNKYRMG